MDLNVENYTHDELVKLLGVGLNPDKITITNAVEEKVAKLQNPEYIQFYHDIEEHLISSLPATTTQNVYSTEVQRGDINPDLKNTIQRMVNVDSFYRQASDSYGFDSDNFSFILNEPITNIISMFLYSIELPQSWYTFTIEKGNIAFEMIITLDSGIDNQHQVETYTCTISSGNYTNFSLMDMVQKIIQEKINLFFPTSVHICTITQNPYTARISIKITNFPNKKCAITFLWVNPTNTNPNMSYSTLTNNLGTFLGFRTPLSIMTRDASFNLTCTAPSIIDTSGTKYVILKLNDHKSNRLNNSLVTINPSPQDGTIPLPIYYTPILPQYNISETQVNVQATTPRTLTSAQLFTINSISQNNAQQGNTRRAQGQSLSDVFAKIPIKRTTDWGVFSVDANGNNLYKTLDNGPGRFFVEFSGPVQLNFREYFGPVTILGFSISLYDDRGNILGLNGMDWSCTFMVRSVYEY